MSAEHLPDWIVAFCAVLTLMLGILMKLVWGLRCYDKRFVQLESDLKHSNEMQMAAVAEVREDLKHEQQRRTEIWEKLDTIQDLLSKAVADMAYLRGQMAAREMQQPISHHEGLPGGLRDT